MDGITKSTKIIIHKSLKAIGFICFFIGILGLFLPVIPGIPLFVIGILILGEESIFSGWVIKKLPKPIRERVQFLLAKKKGK